MFTSCFLQCNILFFQRVRGQRRATSNPTSPVSEARRPYTSPEEIALVQEAIEAGFVVAPGPRSHNSYGEGHSTVPSSPHGSVDRLDRDRVVEAVATIPRKQRRHIPDAESVFNQGGSVGTNPRQPSISHYDCIPARRHPRSVETTFKQQDYNEAGPWEPQRPQNQQQQQRQAQLIRQRSNDYVDPRTIRRQRSQEGGLERQYSHDNCSTTSAGGNYADPVALKRQESRENYVDPQTLRKQQQLRHQQKHQTQPGNVEHCCHGCQLVQLVPLSYQCEM